MEQNYERKWFSIAEFKEEATWLMEKHKEGYRFVSTNGRRYEFEPCEKEDWIYELDFKENGEAEEDYLQLYADYGWEYVYQYRNWFYFRKKKVAGRDENMSIFSDNESKIAMCQRVIKGQFLCMLPAYCLLLFYDYLTFFTDIFRGHDFLSGLVLGAGIGTMLVVLFGVGYSMGQYFKLQKEIEKLENPLK